jgi:hypothetical protein
MAEFRSVSIFRINLALRPFDEILAWDGLIGQRTQSLIFPRHDREMTIWNFLQGTQRDGKHFLHHNRMETEIKNG